MFLFYHWHVHCLSSLLLRASFPASLPFANHIDPGGRSPSPKDFFPLLSQVAMAPSFWSHHFSSISTAGWENRVPHKSCCTDCLTGTWKGREGWREMGSCGEGSLEETCRYKYLSPRLGPENCTTIQFCFQMVSNLSFTCFNLPRVASMVPPLCDQLRKAF
jgi:hypothetical protein